MKMILFKSVLDTLENVRNYIAKAFTADHNNHQGGGPLRQQKDALVNGEHMAPSEESCTTEWFIKEPQCLSHDYTVAQSREANYIVV